MPRATRFSYLFLIAVIVLAAATHLATPLITVLFSYFALRKLYFGKRKWLSLLLFFVVVSATLYGLGFLIRQAFVAFPTMGNRPQRKVRPTTKAPYLSETMSTNTAVKSVFMAEIRI